MGEINPFQPIADFLKPLSTADEDTFEGLGVKDGGLSKGHAKKSSGSRATGHSTKPAGGGGGGHH